MPLHKSAQTPDSSYQSQANRIVSKGHNGSALECHIFVPPLPEVQPGSVEWLRQALDKRRVHYADRDLERFVQQVFLDKTLLAAYFHPSTSIGANPPRFSSRNTGLSWLPFEIALAAASQAHATPNVNNWERSLVHVATFLYPCGLFYRSWEIENSSAVYRLDHAMCDTTHLRLFLLEDALRTLRARSKLKADTLGALLGLDSSEVDAEQVDRLASAVRRVQTAANNIWGASA